MPMLSKSLVNWCVVSACVASATGLSGARAPVARPRSVLHRSRVAPRMSIEALDFLTHAHAFIATAQPALESHTIAVSNLLADASAVMDTAATLMPAVPAVVDTAAPAVIDAAVKTSGTGGPMDMAADLVGQCITGIHDTLAAQGVDRPYGLSIILFTLIVKTLLFPLNYQQIKSTTQMQAIQPKVAAIRAKFAADPNAMNTAIAKLYQDEQLNPLSGCLPSLAQIPVFIALYRALINLAKADKLEEPFLWIPSLEGPVREQGMGLGWLTEWVNGQPQFGFVDTAAYLSLPILLVICQSVSFSILTPPSADPEQKRTQDILKFLPLMIGFFSLSTPAGLVVYWVVNSILTTVQTLVIRQAIGYTPPESAAMAAAALNLDVTTPAAPSKGFGAFKSATPVSLDQWPSSKSEPPMVVTVRPIQPTAPVQSSAQAVTVTQAVGEEEAVPHSDTETDDGSDESRNAAKRKAKAEAKAKGGFKKK